MKMVIIKRDSPEWNYMWGWLECHPCNNGLKEPTLAMNVNGETWHYMASYHKGNLKEMVHEFRHRCHPITQDRMYLSCKASPDVTEESIEKVLSVIS